MEPAAERRSDARVAAGGTRWGDRAILRPGHEIRVLDVSATGVLIETAIRVLPGKRVDLQLTAAGGRCSASGRVVRCRVIKLGPLTHEAAIAFEQRLELVTQEG